MKNSNLAEKMELQANEDQGQEIVHQTIHVCFVNRVVTKVETYTAEDVGESKAEKPTLLERWAKKGG